MAAVAAFEGRVGVDSMDFGAELALEGGKPSGSRITRGAFVLGVGAVAAVAAAGLAWHAATTASRSAAGPAAFVVGIVAFLALRHGFRLVLVGGLPQFHERGLVDRGRLVPYGDLVEVQANIVNHDARGSYLYTAWEVRFCHRTETDVTWTFTSHGPCADFATVLDAVRRENPSVYVRRS